MIAVKHPNANTLVYHCANECFHAEFDVDWLQVNGGEVWCLVSGVWCFIFICLGWWCSKVQAWA